MGKGTTMFMSSVVLKGGVPALNALHEQQSDLSEQGSLDNGCHRQTDTSMRTYASCAPLCIAIGHHR